MHDPALKERLILYNQQDCVALQKVREFLVALPADGEPREAQEGGLRFVEQIKIEEDRPAFGKNRFAVEDFALINKRAYFDYQRDKIYLRTNPRFKNLERRKQQNKKRYRLRPNHVVTLRAVKCPYCQGSNLSRDYTNFHLRHTFRPPHLPQWHQAMDHPLSRALPSVPGLRPPLRAADLEEPETLWP
jgi:hypothetical protein